MKKVFKPDFSGGHYENVVYCPKCKSSNCKVVVETVNANMVVTPYGCTHGDVVSRTYCCFTCGHQFDVE